MNRSFLVSLITGLVLLTALAALVYFVFPWINWGKVQVMPGQTITVVGEAQDQQTSQMATFSAGVDVVNDEREVALSEVNQRVTGLIEAVKSFGIDSTDIKTQNVSMYRSEEYYYDENGAQKSRPGQWRVSNSVTVTLRDITRASALTDLLTASGATNVYGPNFSVTTDTKLQSELLREAINNAYTKAEEMASANGRRLGRVLSVYEGTQPTGIVPLYDGMGGGGGAPIEPGSETVSASVTVTYELQ